MASLLLVEDLSKSYPCGAHILSNASFAMEQGQVVGLSGKSGQGKSTLARLLCGLLRPNSGQALLDGVPLIYPDGSYNTGMRPAVQLIHQQPFAALDRCQTILDAVAEPIYCHRRAQSGKAARKQAAALLVQVGLPTELHRRKPWQLSGGQAQRAAVARALAVSPRLILADEATSALDLPTGRQVIALLQDWVKTTGGGLLLISHDTRMLGAVCHCRYHLQDTKLRKLEEIIHE